ncbi:hypothetical protein [Corallococcus caeni]|uniref:Uncharacterized protein n=1 Tax=Corallococcus caeni TaxID=3082388 RepID=A0ABQ6R186_9BACT|nr:hypothetical protein ASNO1_63190 [Corallococcus sp. NO1]
MSKSSSYKIESEFLEDQVEKDVANYLGYISRLFGPRFRLLQVDEAITGADGQFNWSGKAFYLQFKKPTGLKNPAVAAIPNVPRKNESELQNIRRFRQAQSLADSPYSLCFELRRKAKTATEFQHNVLLSYENPPASRALYVCPTAFTRADYEQAIGGGFLWRFFGRFFEAPFTFADYEIVSNHVRHQVQSAPFLRGHAAIVPHTKVTTADHWYSFSIHGSDIAFHSPEVVRRGVSRLSDFISEEIAAARTFDSLLPLDRLVASLREKANRWAGDTLANEEEGLDWLQAHGRMLRQQHGIRQMVVLVAQEKTGG